MGTDLSVRNKMLFTILLVSAIHLINGHGQHELKSTEELRFKRHDYYWSGRHEFPTFGNHHPIGWGNNGYASYQPNHPVKWRNNDYIYNQEHPTILQNEDITRYTDYHGGWGSFDISTENNGKLLDRQLFPEASSGLQPQVNPINTEVLQRPSQAQTRKSNPQRKPSTPRISELKCEEYLQNRTAREEYNKNVGRTFVVGGRLAELGEFPHMGAVGWKAIKGTWIFICGSSLISPKFMLTAGHCSKVSSRYPNVANTRPEIVRVGSRSITDNPIGKTPYDIKIRRIIVHPQYAPPKKYFDIAIIELMDNAYIDKSLQPACLWTNRDISPLGTKATVTGWGVVETATLKTIPDLQAADVDILPSGLCDNLLRSSCSRLWCGMSGSQLCAGILKGGVDACQGDSGGPLQVKINSTSDAEGSIHYIIGITSFGNGCAQANKPAVYTRVSSFIDWIESVVWGTTT